MKYTTTIVAGTVIAFTGAYLSDNHDRIGQHIEIDTPRPALPINQLTVVSSTAASTSAVALTPSPYL